MKKSLMIDGEVMRIEDGKYYILSEDGEYLTRSTAEEFKEELKKYEKVCTTTWDKKLQREYQEMKEYCMGI
jgi:hypothetical protein